MEKRYKIVPIKEFVVVKRSGATQEQAHEIAKLLKVPAIYMEEWDDVTTHTLDEIQELLDKARSKLKHQ